MSDISKCKGEGCNKKRSCYRFLAPASEYQAYFMDSPIKEDGTCNQYWEVKAEQKKDEEQKKENRK
jgi:hypothetical protein